MNEDNSKEVWLEKLKVVQPTHVYSPKHKTYNTCLCNLPEHLKSDFDLNLVAAIYGKEYSWNLDKQLLDNKNFVLELINNNYSRSLYSYLSLSLKDDPEIFELCLKRKDSFDWGFSHNIINNKELILKLLPTYDIFDKLKNTYDLDKDVLSVQLKYRPDHFTSLKKRMVNYFTAKHRKNFLLETLKSKPYNINFIYNSLPSHFQEDLDFIHLLLSNSPDNIGLVPLELRNDKSFMTYAIDKYNTPVKYSSENLKNDRDIAATSIRKDGMNLLSFPHFMRDVELVNLAIDTCHTFKIIHHDLLSNKDIVLRLLNAKPENVYYLFEKTALYHNDKDVMRIAIKHDLKLFSLSKKLQNDKELCELAIELSGKIDYLHDSMVENREMILTLLKRDPENCAKLFNNKEASHFYNDDREIALLCVQHDMKLIRNFPFLRAEKQFVSLCITAGLKDINLIDNSLFSDIDIVHKFIKANCDNYTLLPIHMRNEEKIALSAIEHGVNYSSIATSKFKNDVDFHIQSVQHHSNFYRTIPNSSPLKYNPHIISSFCKKYKDAFYMTTPLNLVEKYGTDDLSSIEKYVESEIFKNNLAEKLDNKNSSAKKVKL